MSLRVLTSIDILSQSYSVQPIDAQLTYHKNREFFFIFNVGRAYDVDEKACVWGKSILSMHAMTLKGYILQSSDLFTMGAGNWKGESIGSFAPCWGHESPNAFASRTPSNGKGGCGSPKRRSPVLLAYLLSYENTKENFCIRWRRKRHS